MYSKFLCPLMFILCTNVAMARRSVTLCINPDILRLNSVARWLPKSVGSMQNSGSGLNMYSATVTTNDSTTRYEYVLIDARCGAVDTSTTKTTFLEDEILPLSDDNSNKTSCLCRMVKPYATPYFKATKGTNVSKPTDYGSCTTYCAYNCHQTISAAEIPEEIFTRHYDMPNPGSDIISEGFLTPDWCPENYLAIERFGIGFGNRCGSNTPQTSEDFVVFNSSTVKSCFAPDLAEGEPCAMYYYSGYTGTDITGSFTVSGGICNEPIEPAY